MLSSVGCFSAMRLERMPCERRAAGDHGGAGTASCWSTISSVTHLTGRCQPVRRVDDRYRPGRREPGPLAVDDLLVKLAVRLHAAGDAPAELMCRS
jgi:hypothetical protein